MKTEQTTQHLPAVLSDNDHTSSNNDPADVVPQGSPPPAFPLSDNKDTGVGSNILTLDQIVDSLHQCLEFIRNIREDFTAKMLQSQDTFMEDDPLTSK